MMSVINAFTNPYGRMERLPYWGALLTLLAFIALIRTSTTTHPQYALGFLLPDLLITGSVLCISAKRFRDFGWTGYWGFLGLFPIVGLFIGIPKSKSIKS